MSTVVAIGGPRNQVHCRQYGAPRRWLEVGFGSIRIKINESICRNVIPIEQRPQNNDRRLAQAGDLID